MKGITENLWLEVTPMSVAARSLLSCSRKIEAARKHPYEIYFGAVDAYRAIQAALTAVLAGSANIGAHRPKTRQQWLEYFRSPPEFRGAPPKDWSVMPLRQLLITALRAPAEGGTSLTLLAVESFYLERLSFYRDSFEHPKQVILITTVQEIVDAIGGVITLATRIIEAQAWLLYATEFDLDVVKATASRICDLAKEDWSLLELAGSGAS